MQKALHEIHINYTPKFCDYVISSANALIDGVRLRKDLKSQGFAVGGRGFFLGFDIACDGMYIGTVTFHHDTPRLRYEMKHPRYCEVVKTVEKHGFASIAEPIDDRDD